MGKGIHMAFADYCSLFKKPGLTVQKCAMTDVAKPLVGDTHMEIMAVAVSQESNTKSASRSQAERSHTLSF